ncbi:GntR family transcriptional regulator [Pelagimonas varians]|uniref:Putative HTH-type transcriptional regulator YdfH n=1 Tax=Pelagimonas varians TaxID=696760 RepID=A0A238L5K5_9RHOB|nr:GntR family transcriptional regulator [Pelagimonas varians]PYG25523.1 regulatory GntR family protein [Pelagimonas varians]SMX50289.1 putative HTH-type transcriptional regulator YdfH [Pelagimonas varians]
MRLTKVKLRRTGADIAVEYLEDAILTLKPLPGSKISEAEIAAKWGLSRQPVHEAFVRLDSAGMLNIQPQKATTVRKFSLVAIATLRFIWRAIEVEVLHDAINH